MWALYGRTALFRTYDGARRFRMMATRAGDACPQIYTRDGSMLKGNGVRVPWDMRRIGGPNQLRVGIIPAEYTGELKPLTDAIRAFERCKRIADDIVALSKEHKMVLS